MSDSVDIGQTSDVGLTFIAPEKSYYSHNIFLTSPRKHMFPIFGFVCVHCFQRQLFRSLFYFTVTCVK